MTTFSSALMNFFKFFTVVYEEFLVCLCLSFIFSVPTIKCYKELDYTALFIPPPFAQSPAMLAGRGGLDTLESLDVKPRSLIGKCHLSVPRPSGNEAATLAPVLKLLVVSLLPGILYLAKMLYELRGRTFEQIEDNLDQIVPRVEDVSSYVRDVKTGVADVTSKVEDVGIDVKDLKNAVANVNTNVEDVGLHVRDVKPEITEVKTKVEDVGSDVRDVKTGVADVKTKVEEVRSHLMEVKDNIKEIKQTIKTGSSKGKSECFFFFFGTNSFCPCYPAPLTPRIS